MAEMDIGLIGLAVMGENLVLNMESKGFSVAVYNRTVAKVDKFIEGRGKGKNFKGCHSIEELCASLKRPRKVMMLVKAGQPVDDFIEQLAPHLEKGDIIIDGGNSHFPDTIRRAKYCESKGLLYIGTGVSGGEEGALKGPSIMPGGSPAAWEHVKPIFQGIAAKTEDGDAVLRLGRRRRCGPLRQDGPQRHRIRRHADDLRDLSAHEAGPRHVERGNARGLRRMERGRTGFVSHRNHPRHPRAQGRRRQCRGRSDSGHAPARKVRANGPSWRRWTRDNRSR